MKTRTFFSFLFLLLSLNFFPSEAAITWQLPPIPISVAGEDAGSPQVAIDGTGNAVAVWTRFDGSNYRVQAASFDASTSSWSSPTNLSTQGQDADLPQVAINSMGEAVAVWSRFNGTLFVVQAATSQAPTNIWSSPINVSNQGNDSLYPQIGVDRNGDAIAIWERVASDNSGRIIGARLINGTWSSPEPISDSGPTPQPSITPKLAVNPDGEAVAVWRGCNGENGIIHSASFNPGSGWSEPFKLSNDGQSASIPQVGIDRDGNAIAVWRRSNGTNFLIQAATLSNGNWSSPAIISVNGFNSDQPQIAVDLSGRAIATWSIQTNLSTSLIQTAQSNTNASNVWSAPINFTFNNASYNPDIAINQTDAALIWSICDCTLPSAALIQADSTVISVALLSVAQALFGPADPADEPKIAISADDVHVVAVWRGFDGTNNRIWAVIGTFPAPSPPVICISPNQGPVEGGTVVTITGTNLSGATRVTFGPNNPAVFQVDSDTQITAISPPGTGQVNVRVRTPAGISAPEPCNQFTYTNVPPEPPIVCVNPNFGVEAGGTVVTLIGQNLNGATAVFFGPNPALDFTVVSAQRIIATSPPGIGVVNVSVTTPNGTSLAQPCNEFTYTNIPPILPEVCIHTKHGPETGGTTVTLVGTNLAGTTQVYFGPNPAESFTIISDEEIIAVSPPGTGKVHVIVDTPAGNSIAKRCNRFTYTPTNPDFCVHPKVGPETGGTIVTLKGKNLEGATQVLFGTTPALEFTVVSNREITAVSPPGTGTVNVTVITPNGTSSIRRCNQFTYNNTPEPPRAIRVQQVENKFATQTDIVNIVRWSASPTPGVTSYRLYRNGELITRIPADENLVFRDHNRRKGVRTVYAVTALIGKNESQQTRIVFE